MQNHHSKKPNDVAIVEAITSWWSQEMEDRVTLRGWNTHLVTFMFNHIPGSSAVKLELMQDSVCRSYSKLVTSVVRKPNSIHQLFDRPRMITAPGYPIYKHKWDDIASHVARKLFLYRKLPLRSIESKLVKTDLFRVPDYIMKSVKRGRCRWEDVLCLPKSSSELSRE
jgi:hypothetical protein